MCIHIYIYTYVCICTCHIRCERNVLHRITCMSCSACFMIIVSLLVTLMLMMIISINVTIEFEPLLNSEASLPMMLGLHRRGAEVWIKKNVACSLMFYQVGL